MKVALIIFGILVLAVVGFGVYQNLKPQPVGLPGEGNAPIAKYEMERGIARNNANANPYREYNKLDYNANVGMKNRILFFYADWCPICRPVDTDIKANLDKIPDDVEIIRVNYNDDQTDSDEKDLAAKYGVTYQHTFVRIDSAGNDVDKWNGGDFEKLLEYSKSISAKENISGKVSETF